MNSFCLRPAIYLVFILSSRFTFAYVENVTRKPTASVKLTTNFFKPSWINLSNSWIDDVTSHCRNDVVTLFENADAGEMWALQMLDASSRIPAGILTGNLYDLGMYDECIRVTGSSNPANIQGQHCLVSLSIPYSFVIADAATFLFLRQFFIYNPTTDIDLSLTLSVCMPSSCSVDDVVGFVNGSVQRTPELAAFVVNATQIKCLGAENVDNEFTVGRILAILFYITVATLLLLCTLCDIVVRARFYRVSSSLRTAAKFSIYTNTLKLFDTNIAAETMPAIHGFRFLNTFLVIIGHRAFLTITKPFVNLLDLYKIRHSSTISTLFYSLPRAVDSFFVMSGFLTAYSFLKYLRSGKKLNVLVFYLHRYIRFTPCIAAMILFSIFILPYLGSGPMWETVTGPPTQFCRKNWWTNLLYIQNFVNRHEMCMLHTWYLAAEMHFLWICPIILFPLYYRPKLGLRILGALSIFSVIIPAVQIVVYNYSSLVNSAKTTTGIYYEFFDFYTITYNRALPYLIGILLGYDVVNNKRHFTKVQVFFNWILAGFLILLCYWATYFSQPSAPTYDVVMEVAQVTIVRLGWSIATGWILYACTQGYGGPLTGFLSLPIFVPLSRMSYCIYLVSVMIQAGTNATVRTAGSLTLSDEFYLVWGDLAMSILAAFVLNLCFETPAIVLEKILNVEQPSAIIDHVSTRKKEVSALVRKYLDSTRGRVSDDSAVEAIVSELDFWSRVSDVLHDSGNMTSKNPAKLAKIWVEWKSRISENDSQRDSSAEATQDGSNQFENRITRLEQELLTFLQTEAVRDSDNIVNFEKLDIVDPATSCQLDSRKLRHKNPVGLPAASDSIPFDKKTS